MSCLSTISLKSQILPVFANGPSAVPLGLTPSPSVSSSSGSSTLSSPPALVLSPQLAAVMSTTVSPTSSTENTKKVNEKVIVGASNSTVDALRTPQNMLVTPTLGDFPNTAELMQKCLAVNPFELKFKEANRMLGSTGTSQRELEEKGLVPKISIDTPSVSTILKSPGIFTNISLLPTISNGDVGDLKTADFSKLFQHFKEQGGLSTQPSMDCSNAPRTADVLNAVLDMHSDRLHLFNHLLTPSTANILNSLTPAGSAPNSAGVLGVPVTIPQVNSPAQIAAALASAVASTSGVNLAPPIVAISSASPQLSPRNLAFNDLSNSQLRSPQSDLASAVTAAVQASNALIGMNGGLLQALSVDPASWDPRDVKPALVPPGGGSSNKTPQVTPRSDFYDDYGPGVSNGFDHNPRSNESEVSSSCGSLHGTSMTASGTPGRGRGRGRTTTADMPPDERRLTILERNKAAAVRYRKRKKEEHDDMIGRVHILEQEKGQLATQNQVLRRELERVTAVLKEREARCVCLHGLPMSSELGIGTDPGFLHQQNLMQAAMGGLKRKI
ncbi:unnamed protein product, partial [Mesorhabditis belari]|uniref:BZIP domain-containing protein n=1 Tax=Mesorhabditis belari TaxID=2138241 RepID=A0AAF3E8K3_9BILA